jgi:hypothetical protein
MRVATVVWGTETATTGLAGALMDIATITKIASLEIKRVDIGNSHRRLPEKSGFTVRCTPMRRAAEGVTGDSYRRLKSRQRELGA